MDRARKRRLSTQDDYCMNLQYPHALEFTSFLPSLPPSLPPRKNLILFYLHLEEIYQVHMHVWGRVGVRLRKLLPPPPPTRIINVLNEIQGKI